MKTLILSMAVLFVGCGDNLPGRPVACGRYDQNIGIECAEIPGTPIPSTITDGDPWIHVDTSEGVPLLVVHDCFAQCSPSPPIVNR
jgi:hypothetical protein